MAPRGLMGPVQRKASEAYNLAGKYFDPVVLEEGQALGAQEGFRVESADTSRACVVGAAESSAMENEVQEVHHPPTRVLTQNKINLETGANSI